MGHSAANVVAAYVRVSTPSQDYDYQRFAIEQAAAARGEYVHHWFGDVASGSRMDRPQLLRCRDWIRQGRIQRLWVWRLDRVTRSGIVDLVSCINEIQRHGCTVSSVTDAFPLDGPAGEIFLAIVAWSAQQERLKILENQAAARQRALSTGAVWGKPPVPIETQRAVRDLSSQGKSVREIASELTLQGHRVSKSSVCKILRGEMRPPLKSAISGAGPSRDYSGGQVA